MSLNIFYHSDFLNHNINIEHPECPDRLKVCVSALKNCHFKNRLNWKTPRTATEKELQLIHSVGHIQNIKKICDSGGGIIDHDTVVSKNSFKIALLSAGAWLDAVNQILKGKSSLVLSRPPGHHAERNKAMGFCIFSNAALAAVIALKYSHVKKVAIFDWDVHHGNGTQSIVEKYPNIYYVSIHQFPFYPGTGFRSETGINNNVLNIPLSSGVSSDKYIKIFDDLVFPFICKSSPEIIIISAGFDAHYRDPLANFNLHSEDFVYMIKRIREIRSALLLGLEGGYDLLALKKCCEAVACALL